MSRAMPPRLATWMLGCLLSAADKDAVIGDLTEEHALRSPLDPSSGVSWWYWSQVSRSVPPLFWAGVRRGRGPGILGAAIAAYVLATVVESAGELAASRLLGPDSLVRTLISLFIGLSAMVLGGYVAAWIRRGAAATLAVIVAVIVIGLMATMGDTVPLWYQVGFLVFGPLAALAGGALVRRQAR